MNDLAINRRSLLGLFGATTAAGLPSGAGAAQAVPVRFDHGVASGDPAADGAVIWTRASTAPDVTGDMAIGWQVAGQPGGAPVASGQAIARASADRTVKVEVEGLKPGREYWYRFAGSDGTLSAEGRFRTLPVGRIDSLVLAVTSCQLYPGGFYNAYAEMAKRDRLDAVIHLGDYIYEYGPEGYGGDIGQRLGRIPQPGHEILTLDDYRSRHAQVKADPDMQAAHARAAFICVWDDHEVTNDGWVGGAENHQEDTEGAWSARKAVAMQAYFEWMPIRDPSPLRAREAIFRSFEFGDLATLAMTETRLLARSKQMSFAGEPGKAEDYAAFLAQRAREDREMLGTDQRDWLTGVLKESVDAGKPWQLIGNQVVMARVAGPDLEQALGTDRYGALLAKLPAPYDKGVPAAVEGYRNGVPFNLDSWDGYPAARERLYSAFREAGTRPIVLAGDSHAGWANNLHDDAGNLVAVESGCTAISSPSYGALLPGIGALIAQANDEVAYCNQDLKGYTLLTLDRDTARADYITVSTVLSCDFTAKVDASFVTGAKTRFGPWTKEG